MKPLPTALPARRRTVRTRSRGLTLVELLVSMLLGLMILGGVVGIFISNRQAFRTTEQLARVQENVRIAFELMSRSIREAGGNPCGRNLPTANVVNNAATTWWANWGDGLRGYAEADGTFPAAAFGTAHGTRVAGTEALTLMFGDSNNGTNVISHNPTSAQFKVSTIDHGLEDGDIVMVCDYKQAAIMQVTNASDTNPTVVHNTGTGTPGNCSKGLGIPTICSAVGKEYVFEGGQLVKLVSQAWYIGNFVRDNGRTGRSLFRVRLQAGAGVTATTVLEEIAEGVRDMQMEYLIADASGAASSYVEAGGVTDWTAVLAVRMTLTFEGTERLGTDGNTLRRQSVHVISLRNRAS